MESFEWRVASDESDFDCVSRGDLRGQLADAYILI